MNIVVFGGNGGIGAALVRKVNEVYPEAQVFATWNCSPPAADSGATWTQLDLCSEESIHAYASQFESVHWVINAAGMLHQNSTMPEKSLQQLDPEFFLTSMELNALPTLLIAKHFKKPLSAAAVIADATVQFATVSAKVGSIADNRLGGWHSYRCSKAALNMAIKNISIEWRRTLPDACVTALHPGTTKTSLSKPFQRNVPDGKLFSPDKTAGLLVDQMLHLTVADTGSFISYDGERLPW